MEHEGHPVTRAQFEENMRLKRADAQFTADIEPLLASGHAWDFDAAAASVCLTFVERLPGEPWRGV